MALLGLDLVALGITITVWDAFDEGKTVRTHLMRSFVSALYYAGALALIANLFGGNQMLLSPLEAESADPEQFTRLTRRALSHLGDLPKLATNPLVNLSAVTGSNPIDRAQSLKNLLLQSVQKLKPHTEATFGTTDEWRYFNAVYFPYALGLKPYARRAEHDSLDDISCAALDWFQSTVPERTLHNWQNAAAKLIAEDIRTKGDLHTILAVDGSPFRGHGSGKFLQWAERSNSNERISKNIEPVSHPERERHVLVHQRTLLSARADSAG
jgi:hypothetical protein